MSYPSAVLSIFVAVNCLLQGIDSLRVPNELTHIDSVRENYLNVEANLWSVIKSGAENSFVLKRISDAHIKFFAEPLYEKEVHLTTFDPDQQILKIEIEEVNHRITALRKNYLRTNVNELNRNQAISFAENGIAKRPALDKIFNVTDDKDFFRYIRNVSFQFSLPCHPLITKLHMVFANRKAIWNHVWQRQRQKLIQQIN